MNIESYFYTNQTRDLIIKFEENKTYKLIFFVQDSNEWETLDMEVKIKRDEEETPVVMTRYSETFQYRPADHPTVARITSREYKVQYIDTGNLIQLTAEMTLKTNVDNDQWEFSNTEYNSSNYYYYGNQIYKVPVIKENPHSYYIDFLSSGHKTYIQITTEEITPTYSLDLKTDIRNYVKIYENLSEPKSISLRKNNNI